MARVLQIERRRIMFNDRWQPPRRLLLLLTLIMMPQMIGGHRWGVWRHCGCRLGVWDGEPRVKWTGTHRRPTTNLAQTTCNNVFHNLDQKVKCWFKESWRSMPPLRSVTCRMSSHSNKIFKTTTVFKEWKKLALARPRTSVKGNKMSPIPNFRFESDQAFLIAVFERFWKCASEMYIRFSFSQFSHFYRRHCEILSVIGIWWRSVCQGALYGVCCNGCRHRSMTVTPHPTKSDR